MFSHIGKYSNVYMNIKYMTFYLHESFHLFQAKIIYLLFFTEEFNESDHVQNYCHDMFSFPTCALK